MICPSCGKLIPNESKFCLYCGGRIPAEALTPVDKPPARPALVVVEFRPCGPAVTEPGYLNERLRRGFEFTIGLRDSNWEEIQLDSELIAALMGPYPNASTSPHLLGPSLKTARSIGARTDILWHRSFAIKPGDLESRTIHRAGSPSDSEKPLLVYTYRETAPILSVDADYCLELHTWFILPTGQCLYQTSVTLWSR